MLNAAQLMRLHIGALFTVDAMGRLVAVNEPGGAAAPRFFLGRTPEGDAWWFRHDVGDELAREIQALSESRRARFEIAQAIDPTPLVSLLERDSPVQKTWGGPAFTLPDHLPGPGDAIRVTPENAAVLSPYLEPWLGDITTCAPMFAVLQDGKAVSLCGSVRVTPQAHEAGVDTHPDFRRRGCAARAVSAWARAVRALGAVPLYSTSWKNTGSLAVAKKLGLIQFGADLHIT